jgi:hypothetical protein
VGLRVGQVSVFRSVLFALFLASSLVATAFDQLPQVGVTPERRPLAKGILEGRISDYFGRAVAGAKITAGDDSAVSGPPGSYRLEISLPDTGGTYLANVEAYDYNPKSALVKLMPGDTTVHDFVLLFLKVPIKLSLRFKPKSAAIDQPGNMDTAVRVLKDNPEYIFEIKFHCFDWVSNRRNLRTSQRRAEVIRKLLLAKGGIDSTQFVAKGYGATQPVVGIDYPIPRERQKSRVELWLLP